MKFKPADREFVDISWQIVYSGRSHLKLMLSDGFPRFADYNMTETKEVQQEVQLTTETIRQFIIPKFCHSCSYTVGRGSSRKSCAQG